jgi:hypothetical protein
MIASFPIGPSLRPALVLAGTGTARLITFPGPVNADPVACLVVPPGGAVKALARAGFARKKVRADDCHPQSGKKTG